MWTAQNPMRVRGKRRMASKITSCWRRQRASRRQGKPMTTAAVNPGLLHGRHHLLRPHQFGLGRIVQQAEGRFIGKVILPPAADFLRKDMGVTIQNHAHTMALNVQRRKPFLRLVTLGKIWFFLSGSETQPRPDGHFPLVYPLFFDKISLMSMMWRVLAFCLLGWLVLAGNPAGAAGPFTYRFPQGPGRGPGRGHRGGPAPDPPHRAL